MITNPNDTSKSRMYAAEIDTGTWLVGLDPRVIEELGIEVLGAVDAHTTAGHETSKQGITQALVRLVSDTENHDFGLRACSLHAVEPFDQIQVLIGRNILRHFRFLYDGFTDTYTLEYMP